MIASHLQTSKFSGVIEKLYFLYIQFKEHVLLIVDYYI